MNKDAFIPLYLNNDITDKLYTIAVNVFVETKSVSTKNLVSVAINTPLSELTCDSFGKYMQGDLHLQLTNEFSKQNTQERISIQILVLLELMDILSSNNLLKEIKTIEDINNIKENDFVEFKCKLNLNPTIEYFENIIKAMELDSMFNLNTEIKNDTIQALKSKLSDVRKINCIKYVANNICDTDICAALPIINNYLGDNLNYALDSNVKILGKVVKICNERGNDKINLCTGTCFDFLDNEYISNIENGLLKGVSRSEKYNNLIKKQFYNPIMEIVPILLYV